MLTLLRFLGRADLTIGDYARLEACIDRFATTPVRNRQLDPDRGTQEDGRMKRLVGAFEQHASDALGVRQLEVITDQLPSSPARYVRLDGGRAAAAGASL